MELPGIGDHCSHPDCNLLDFLPFTCSLCGNKYCQNHHKYEDHSCPDRYKLDVQVPMCPICDKPVSSKRGLPPDLAVNEHLERNCQSNVKKTNRNRCSLSGCKIKELISIQCDCCKLNFCLRHRHTTDHDCAGHVAALRERTLNGSIFKNWFSGNGRTDTNAAPAKASATTKIGPTSNKKKFASTMSRPTRILEVSPSVRKANVSTYQGNLDEEEALQTAILKSQGNSASGVEVSPALSEDEQLARVLALSLEDQGRPPNRQNNTNSSSDCAIS